MTMLDGPLLEVVNLRTHIQDRHGTVRAVDDVSFKLGKGQTMAIVGASGCGKSILCRTIIGLLPENAVICQGSSLLFNGRQLVGLKESQFNRLRATQLAIIFQDQLASLHPTMTVGRQIGESLRWHRKLTPGETSRRVAGLLDAVGLPDPGSCADLFPHQLSGGMRQRVAIAIALACDPHLLIADEPTTALDATVQAGILMLLNQLQTARKMSMLIATHDLGVASNVADRIAVMHAGKFVEAAPAPEIFKRPCHPYTRALIAAVPGVTDALRKSSMFLDARPFDCAGITTGCRFSSRCPQAEDVCRRQEPPLRAGSAGNHQVACWQPSEGP